MIDAVTASIVDASSSSSFVAQPLELRLHQLLRGGRRLDLRPAGVARCRREGGDTTLATELLHYFIFSISPPAHHSANLDPRRPRNPFGVAQALGRGDQAVARNLRFDCAARRDVRPGHEGRALAQGGLQQDVPEGQGRPGARGELRRLPPCARRAARRRSPAHTHPPRGARPRRWTRRSSRAAEAAEEAAPARRRC